MHNQLIVITPVDFLHAYVCFQSALINLLTEEIFLDFEWLAWAR